MSDASRRRARILWSTGAVVALAWPARTIGLLDGIPFDTRVEAVLLGLAVPALWWFDRSVFDRSAARVLVAALLALKVASTALLTQAGLCTAFRAERPIAGEIEAIRFDDPSGALPSWDVRASGSCSAITARAYRSRAEFPTWFVNLLDNVNPPQSRVLMRISGVVVAPSPGTLTLETTPDMDARVEVDQRPATVVAGRHAIALGGGPHVLTMTGVLTAASGKLEAFWDGADLWKATRTTVAPPSRIDRIAAPLVGPAIGACALVLLALWIARAARTARLRPIEWAWIGGASAALAMGARAGFDRPAVLLLFGVLLLPAAARRANVRGGFLLIGIPWLALFAVSSLDRIAAFSVYTRGNDWLTYQISAYRIYRFGAWLEAGEKVFYYQPLYRWICGALHLVFGDSSVGELYWDAACLLAGALLALHLAKRAGRLSAMAAAVAVLSIAAIGPIWHLIGRGLAEITAAGFATLAMFSLLRAGRSGAPAAAAGGVFAVLAYYSRLNHMLFAGGLLALILPLRVQARALRHPLRLLARLDWSAVAVYGGVLALGLVALATRTWYYGGRFSVFQGTSLGLNYLGFDPSKVAHSVVATAIGNESFDVRGLPILVGVVFASLAILQVPRFAALPLGPALVCLSGLAGAFIAHAHGYPGRFAVHLLPVATALAISGIGVLVAPIVRRRDHFAADRAARPEVA